MSGAGKLDHTTPLNVKGLALAPREATAILSTCSVLLFKCMTGCAPAYLTSIKVRKKIGRLDKDNQELGNVETLGVENTCTASGQRSFEKSDVPNKLQPEPLKLSESRG